MHHMKLTKYRRNIAKCLDILHPREYFEAQDWYNSAHTQAKLISIASGIDLVTVCKVIAVLSPAVKWERNLLDARNICIAYANYGHYFADEVIVCTYGTNKQKALKILGKQADLEPSSEKTYNFYRNILAPQDHNYVTIDRHAAKVLEDDLTGGSVAISKKLYAEYKEAYTILAKEYKVTPSTLQAMAWVGYKKLTGR